MTAYLIVTLAAIVIDGFSGVAALAHFAPIMPGMRAAGVPVSWLRFPIGTLKVLGALGLLAGLWLPAVGVAAASGLVVFFVCAMYTHVMAKDVSAQFGFAGFLLALNAAALALTLAEHWR
ncbi:DoxX family protein [Galbitalea sp. SE-J8]|uniref:DoxX family protein n=1 Tax=Galbitalea sp. SE-J8 TaxID=3054952 RepID=UPI00259C836D|nr:DoxX family protein [Galbitalea sp. SE-J8]MDM4763785.1 DoxX family protein [Galbitalea sp. SE-J8]